MKQKIRSYLVFASFWYKIIMFIVLPAVLLGIQVFSAAAFGGTSIPLSLSALVMMEIMADNWFLGGIQEKNSEKIDYLKTSAKGMKVMESALIMDLARRFLSCVGIFGISWLIMLIFGAPEGSEKVVMIDSAELLLAVFLTYTLSVLGIFLARFTSYLWVNLLCGYIGAIAGLIIFLVGAATPFPAVLIDIAMAVLGVGLSVLAVKIAMIKVEGSYYDK